MKMLICLGCWMLLTAAPLVHAADDPVTIEAGQASVDYKTYDPANPPAGMPPLTPNEAGVTVSEFGVATALGGSVPDTSDPPGATRVKIDSVKITLSLKITIWVSTTAPQKTHDHEAGHRDIALAYYAKAAPAAHRIAASFVGKTLTGRGQTSDAASSAALNDAANQIGQQYMAAINDAAEKAQVAFDAITEHGTNAVKEADAIKQAMAQEQHDAATAPSADAGSRPIMRRGIGGDRVPEFKEFLADVRV